MGWKQECINAILTEEIFFLLPAEAISDQGQRVGGWQDKMTGLKQLFRLHEAMCKYESVQNVSIALRYTSPKIDGVDFFEGLSARSSAEAWTTALDKTQLLDS